MGDLNFIIIIFFSLNTTLYGQWRSVTSNLRRFVKNVTNNNTQNTLTTSAFKKDKNCMKMRRFMK